MRVNCVLADRASPREDFARHGSAPLALLSFAMLIVSLDQYIVVVALPEIGRDLGHSPQTLQRFILREERNFVLTVDGTFGIPALNPEMEP
jgi:hypothetical protein